MSCRDRGVVYQDVDVAAKLRFQRAGDEVRAVGGEDVGGDADKFGLGGACRVRYARAGGAGEGGSAETVCESVSKCRAEDGSE